MSRFVRKTEDGTLYSYNGYQCLEKLYALEDLLEKYKIEDLSELEIALDQYYHRYDNVQTRRVNDNE